jgi:Transposase
LTAIADLPVEWLAATYAPEGRGAVHAIRWRQEYGGMSVPQARRLKELERENARLREAVADLTLDKMILQEAGRGN